MLLSLLLRSLIPVLLLLSQVPAIAAVPGLPVTVVVQTPAELGKQITELKQKIDDQQKYNSDLMNTVFFSLLGSVLTVTTGFLAIKVLVDAIDRERQRKEIVAEAQRDIVNFADGKLNMLEARIEWLEYQMTSLSAAKLEENQGPETFCAVQSRLQGIQALRRLHKNHQEEMALRPIRSEFKSIKCSLENLVSKKDSLNSLDLLLRNSVPEMSQFNEAKRQNSLKMIEQLAEDDDLKKLGLDSKEFECIRDLLIQLKSN